MPRYPWLFDGSPDKPNKQRPGDHDLCPVVGILAQSYPYYEAYVPVGQDGGPRHERKTCQTYRRRLLGLLLAAVILIPSLLGFGNKFIELIRIYRGDADGAFAVAPITNYILASTGFLLLFFWAAANGMFRDIERPKYAMLENDTPARYAAQTHSGLA